MQISWQTGQRRTQMNVNIPIPEISRSLFPYLWLVFLAISIFFWWRVYQKGAKRLSETKEEVYIYPCAAAAIAAAASAVGFAIVVGCLIARSFQPWFAAKSTQNCFFGLACSPRVLANRCHVLCFLAQALTVGRNIPCFGRMTNAQITLSTLDLDFVNVWTGGGFHRAACGRYLSEACGTSILDKRFGK